MKIINLIENTEGAAKCQTEHGLSFYIETFGHKLLVDTGASDAFISNAEILGVDLEQVDTVFLSHGHYDHAGGILAFLEKNEKAKIYLHQMAGKAYYHKTDTREDYIGIDLRILESPQVELVDGNTRMDDALFLFSGVSERKLWPSGNLELKVKKGEGFVQDEFLHEQYLVIEEDGKKVLVSGCAHNGILNILQEYHNLYGEAPDVVISGFHMQKKNGYSEEDFSVIKGIAEELKTNYPETKFYTGHCTGEIPYQIMKEIMGEQLDYVHSGDRFEI